MDEFQDFKKDLSTISLTLKKILEQIQERKAEKLDLADNQADPERQINGSSGELIPETPFKELPEHSDDIEDKSLLFLRNKTFNKDLRSLITDITKNPGDEAANQSIINADEDVKIIDDDISLSEKLIRYREQPFEEDKELFFFLEEFLKKDELLSSKTLQSLLSNSEELDLTNLFALLKKEISLFGSKESGKDLLGDFLLTFWGKERDAENLLNRFSTVCFYIAELLKAKSCSCFVYSVKETYFRSIFHQGLDEKTAINLAFVPNESIIKKLLNLQSPYELLLFPYQDDPFIKKKISREFWNRQDQLLFFPILSNFKEIKPKNLMFILYILPYNEEPSNTDLFILKNKIHYLLGIFFPLVDIFQEIRKKEKKNDFQVVDEIYAYLNDRRAYYIENGSSNNKQFVIINFRLIADNPVEHNVSFQYLVTKIRKYLSYNSKILRYSYDKGYIVLRGRDSGFVADIVQIMREHSESVIWKQKAFPDYGRNLFNYQ